MNALGISTLSARGLFPLVALLLAGCFGKVIPTPASPTAGKAASAVPGAIASVRTNNEAAWRADQQRAANAAASVLAVRDAGTNQLASPFTDFVNQELGVAARNLPSPDPLAALDAEKRRLAVFAGRLDEVTRLYSQAQGEATRLASEAMEAKARADAAQSALMRAESEHAAQLARNQAENQAKLDAADKRANEAEEKAKNERHKFIFRSLVGLGLLCLAAGIAIAVMTNGMSLLKSSILAGAGVVCIGIAQIVSHPWFDAVFGSFVGLVIIGGAVYVWLEKKGATARDGYQRTIDVMERTGALAVPVKDDAGRETTLGAELSRELDRPQKQIVDAVKRKLAIRAAKTP